MFKCKNISRFLLEIECYAEGKDGGDLVKRKIYPGRDFYTPEPFIDRRVAYALVKEDEPEKPKVVTVMATPVPTAQEQQPIDLPPAGNWVEPIIDENQDEIDGEMIESLAEHKTRAELFDMAKRFAGTFDGEPNPHPRTGRKKLIKWIVEFNERHPDESSRIYNGLNG